MEVPGYKIFKGSICILAVVCLTLLAGLASEAQAKPTVYTIAFIGDLTGPYATILGPMAPGMEDAIEYVNTELGGIGGVPLKVHIRDNKGQVSIGLQQYAELVELRPKPLFMSVIHAPTAEVLLDKYKQDGIISIVGSSVPALYPAGNAYGIYPLYEELVAVGAKAARDMWKEKRNPRAAILTWDTSYGRTILTPEFLDYLKKIKVDLVATELFGIRDPDVTTQMVRIRAKKPDWVLTSIAGGGYLAIVKAAKELGMNLRMVSHSSLELMAKIKPQLFEGSIIGHPARSFADTWHPGIQSILKYFKKNKRAPKEAGVFYTVGWQYILTVRKVVMDAVAKVGWDKLNVDALKNEMNHLTDFTPLDGVSKITYTAKRRTTPWAFPCKISKGKIVHLYDPKGMFSEAPDLRAAKDR